MRWTFNFTFNFSIPKNTQNDAQLSCFYIIRRGQNVIKQARLVLVDLKNCEIIYRTIITFGFEIERGNTSQHMLFKINTT